MYFKRTIEGTIEKLSKSFPAIVVYGPRQCGKSTVVNHVFKERIQSVTLDDPDDLALAINNPKLFLDTYPWPLIIDEIQRAPVLLSVIKRKIDERKQKWMENNQPNQLRYVLTSSNQFELQQGISESLAGRVGVLEMNSFSLAEQEGIEGVPFDPDRNELFKKEQSGRKKYSMIEVFQKIFNGGMPGIVSEGINRDEYFRSYVSTYLEKDIRPLISTGSETEFLNFLSYVALRTGQEVKYDDIASAIGINTRTVKRWLSILQTSGIIAFLQPFRKNTSNRIIKSPKLYFMDTGLASYLCRWPDAEMLSRCAMSGAFFETFVVSERIKSLRFHGLDYRFTLYYYRDIDQKEVDVLYFKNQTLYPIEIKQGINPTKPNKNFNVLEKYHLPIQTGIILDCTDKIRPINERVYTVPVGFIE